MLRGDRLRELRESFQMRPQHAANQLQMGRAQLMKYETGKSDATTEVLIRIAKFYGVSTDYLLGLTDQPSAFGTRDLSQPESDLISWWRKREFIQVMRILFQSLVDPQYKGDIDPSIFRDIEFQTSTYTDKLKPD